MLADCALVHVAAAVCAASCGICAVSYVQIHSAHVIGVTAVSWAPAVPAGSMVGSQPPSAPVKRLCTAGCDNTVKVGVAAVLFDSVSS